MDHGRHGDGRGGLFASRANLILIIFLAIGAFYLITEHRAHLWGWWPWLLLLAAAIAGLYAWLFMQGGHGGHRGSDALHHGARPGHGHQPPHQH
jgi:hypothetical protein